MADPLPLPARAACPRPATTTSSRHSADREVTRRCGCRDSSLARAGVTSASSSTPLHAAPCHRWTGSLRRDRRCRAARPRRGRRPARASWRGCRPATGRSSSTTGRPTAPPAVAADSGRSSCTRARRGFGAACYAGLRRGDAPTSCASWTPTVRSTLPTCRWLSNPCSSGHADLVLAARLRRARRVAAARPAGQPCACRSMLRRRTGACACTTSGRCGPPAAVELLALAHRGPAIGLAARDGASEPPPRRGASTRRAPGYAPSDRPLQGDGHRPRHRPSGP